MALLETNNKRQRIHGVVLMLISGCLCAVISFLIKWYSERTQYSVPKILLQISSFQLLFALISSVIKCDIKMSIKLNLNDTLKSINSIKHNRCIQNKRSPISINSEKKRIILHHTTPSKSISYGSMTTYLSTQHLYPKHTLLQSLNQCDVREERETSSKISQYFIEELSLTKLCIAILSQATFNVLAICTFVESQTQIHFTDALTLKSFSVIIAAILGKVVLDDALSRYHIIGIVIMLFSCLLIVQPSIMMQYIYSNDYPLCKWSGYLLAIISAFCAAYTSLCVRIASKAPLFLLTISQALCNIVGFICMMTLWYNERLEFYHDIEDIWFAATGGLTLYLYSLSFTKGTRKLRIGASHMMETGSVMVLGWFLFHEHINDIAIVGVCLSMIAIVVIFVGNIKTKHDKLSCDAFSRYKYSQYGGCETEKDVYGFDEDAKAGYTTLIL